MAISIRCVAPGHQRVMTPDIAVYWTFRWLTCGSDVSWCKPIIRTMFQHAERASLACSREFVLMLLQQDTSLHGMEVAVMFPGAKLSSESCSSTQSVQSVQALLMAESLC